MNNRPAISMALRRSVNLEAGHRCAIPTCKTVPVEIAHIVPWVECREHKFENLIALCPTCHTRFDKGDIDRKSMLAYKHNLGVMYGRYGDIERRVLWLFARDTTLTQIILPGGHEIHLMYLLEDGLLSKTGQTSGITLSGMPSQEGYALTEAGRALIDHWVAAEELQ